MITFWKAASAPDAELLETQAYSYSTLQNPPLFRDPVHFQVNGDSRLLENGVTAPKFNAMVDRCRQTLATLGIIYAQVATFNLRSRDD